MNDPHGWQLQFASDNTAGICPEALAAFNAANVGWAAAYGSDDWTHVVCNRIRQLFDTDCEVFFRLQRHRRQFAGARGALPVLSQRHLRRNGARRDRRVRRAGILLQWHQAAASRADARPPAPDSIAELITAVPTCITRGHAS